jgi:hypothetical protein
MTEKDGRRLWEPLPIIHTVCECLKSPHPRRYGRDRQGLFVAPLRPNLIAIQRPLLVQITAVGRAA